MNELGKCFVFKKEQVVENDFLNFYFQVNFSNVV